MKACHRKFRLTKSPLAVAVMASLATMAPMSGASEDRLSTGSSQAVLLAAKNPCAANPCAAKNPCAVRNPCAGRNPCAANPCAAKNPCAGRNPCGANPCAGRAQIDPKLITRPRGTKLASGDRRSLMKEGRRLWNDNTISTNGMACSSCHKGGTELFQPTFAEPYPHKVAMPAAMAGRNTIALDEMVQICMVVPMAAKPLPWQSRELAALTAYTGEVQKQYVAYLKKNPCAGKVAANPCAANPCAAKNPCAGRNPCAANPCAAKNPCAANPCAAKNPCGANPCGAKKY